MNSIIWRYVSRVRMDLKGQINFDLIGGSDLLINRRTTVPADGRKERERFQQFNRLF